MIAVTGGSRTDPHAPVTTAYLKEGAAIPVFRLPRGWSMLAFFFIAEHQPYISRAEKIRGKICGKRGHVAADPLIPVSAALLPDPPVMKGCHGAAAVAD